MNVFEMCDYSLYPNSPPQENDLHTWLLGGKTWMTLFLVMPFPSPQPLSTW